MIIKIVIIVIALYIIYNLITKKCPCGSKQENFGRINGKYCRPEDCNKKTFGQCLDCFNCGFCINSESSGVCKSGLLLVT